MRRLLSAPRLSLQRLQNALLSRDSNTTSSPQCKFSSTPQVCIRCGLCSAHGDTCPKVAQSNLLPGDSTGCSRDGLSACQYCGLCDTCGMGSPCGTFLPCPFPDEDSVGFNVDFRPLEHEIVFHAKYPGVKHLVSRQSLTKGIGCWRLISPGVDPLSISIVPAHEASITEYLQLAAQIGLTNTQHTTIQDEEAPPLSSRHLPVADMSDRWVSVVVDMDRRIATFDISGEQTHQAIPTHFTAIRIAITVSSPTSGVKFDLSGANIPAVRNAQTERVRVPHTHAISSCRVCTRCAGCTGYGHGCVRHRTTDRDRDRGQLCGCGYGEAGCSACGMCEDCSELCDCPLERYSPSPKSSSAHVFERSAARVCTHCVGCTEHGLGCQLHRQHNRDGDKGKLCGCGVGSGGCERCGICENCATDIPDCPGAADYINEVRPYPCESEANASGYTLESSSREFLVYANSASSHPLFSGSSLTNGQLRWRFRVLKSRDVSIAIVHSRQCTKSFINERATIGLTAGKGTKHLRVVEGLNTSIIDVICDLKTKRTTFYLDGEQRWQQCIMFNDPLRIALLTGKGARVCFDLAPPPIAPPRDVFNFQDWVSLEESEYDKLSYMLPDLKLASMRSCEVSKPDATRVRFAVPQETLLVSPLPLFVGSHKWRFKVLEGDAFATAVVHHEECLSIGTFREKASLGFNSIACAEKGPALMKPVDMAGKWVEVECNITADVMSIEVDGNLALSTEISAVKLPLRFALFAVSEVSVEFCRSHYQAQHTSEHEFYNHVCRICTACSACSGYDHTCVRHRGRDRRFDRGEECGCGVGEAGCRSCGMCTKCAEGTMCPGFSPVRPPIPCPDLTDAAQSGFAIAKCSPEEVVLNSPLELSQLISSKLIVNAVYRWKFRVTGTRACAIAVVSESDRVSGAALHSKISVGFRTKEAKSINLETASLSDKLIEIKCDMKKQVLTLYLNGSMHRQQEIVSDTPVRLVLLTWPGNVISFDLRAYPFPKQLHELRWVTERQLYLGRSDPESLLSALPVELVEMIVRHIWHPEGEDGSSTEEDV